MRSQQGVTWAGASVAASEHVDRYEDEEDEDEYDSLFVRQYGF